MSARGPHVVVMATFFVWTNAQVFITNVREIIAKNEVKERNQKSSC